MAVLVRCLARRFAGRDQDVPPGRRRYARPRSGAALSARAGRHLLRRRGVRGAALVRRPRGARLVRTLAAGAAHRRPRVHAVRRIPVPVRRPERRHVRAVRRLSHLSAARACRRRPHAAIVGHHVSPARLRRGSRLPAARLRGPGVDVGETCEKTGRFNAERAGRAEHALVPVQQSPQWTSVRERGDRRRPGAWHGSLSAPTRTPADGQRERIARLRRIPSGCSCRRGGERSGPAAPSR